MTNLSNNQANKTTRLILDALAIELSLPRSALSTTSSSRDNVVCIIEQDDNSFARVSLNKTFKDVEEEGLLIKYLYNNGLPCAEPIGTLDLVVDGNNYGVLISKSVDHSVPKKISASHIVNMAEQLAALHELSSDYCRNHEYTQERNPTIDIKKFLDLLESSKADNKLQVTESMLWGLNFHDKISDKDNRPSLVLHNDYRAQNVLFGRSDRISALIDFDWAVQSSNPEKDVAHAAMELSMQDGDTEFVTTRYDMFVQAYKKRSKLDVDLSRESLYRWSRFAALGDSAYYFLSFPERFVDGFSSYMYDKATHFNKLLKNE